jgi:hypothetical protein
MMHPELALLVYKQEERELQQRLEHERVALERTATTPRMHRRSPWDAVRSWSARRATTARAELGPTPCCA